MKLMNVSGVPLCFDGVSGTVRFLIGETKDFAPEEVTQSIQDGIDARLLSVLPSVSLEKKSARKSSKTNKEVTE